MTSEWESSNVEDMYFIGVITGAKDVGKYFSSFVSGFRCNVEFLSLLLEQMYHDIKFPYEVLQATLEVLTERIIDRANKSAALVSQLGFICKQIVLDRESDSARYCKGLTVEYKREISLTRCSRYFILTLEYGDFSGKNPLCVSLDPDPEKSTEDLYAHPVVRMYIGARLIAEHRVLENLENDWVDFQFLRRSHSLDGAGLRALYQDRLRKFLGLQFGGP